MPKTIFFIVLGIITVGIVIVVIRKIIAFFRRAHSTMSDVRNIIKTVSDLSTQARENPDDFVQQKSIGGATSMYLPRIQSDFPDFHKSAAESDIKTFILDMLQVKHCGKEKIDKKIANKNVTFNISKTSLGEVKDVNFHKIAIYDYIKTQTYATIKYKVSYGYRFNDRLIETRCALDYTYSISDKNIATVAATCRNCGAPLEFMKNGSCPYCGAKITQDTILSWSISNFTENI